MKVKCSIKPVTKRLKQIVKEHGSRWFAITPIQQVQCFDGGLGVKVISEDGSHTRWVKYPDEISF